MNDFGKFCRKLRIDHDEVMKDMALRLDCSSSFLCAVENGKKKILDSWYDRLIESYGLDREMTEQLRIAIDLSMDTISITLKEKSEADRHLIRLFFEKFDKLSAEERSTIAGILGIQDYLAM